MIPFLNPMMMGGAKKPDGPDIVTDFSPTTLPFTMRAFAANGTLSRQTANGVYGTRRMRLAITYSATQTVSPIAQWTDIPETGENMEVLTLMQASYVHSNSLAYRVYLSYKSGNHNGYGISFSDGSVSLQRYTSASTASQLALSSAASRPRVLDTWTWFRLRREGRVIKAKWWKDGDPEPEAWGLTGTDGNASALAPGGVAIGASTPTGSGITASYYTDWIGVDMEGGRVKPPYEV
jgi:hypothetical protein